MDDRTYYSVYTGNICLHNILKFYIFKLHYIIFCTLIVVLVKHITFLRDLKPCFTDMVYTSGSQLLI